MKIQTLAIGAFAAGFILTAPQTLAEEMGSSIQGLLGVVRYDNLEISNLGGTGEDVSLDISDMPQFGGAWSTAPKGEKLQFGLECTFLMSFKYGDQNNSTTTANYYSDYSMWLFDLAGGAYANAFLGKAEKVRLYISGGPLLLGGSFRSTTFEDNIAGTDYYYANRETGWGYGLYARTGLEIRIREKGLLGVGFRGTWSELDISNVSDLNSMAAFVTYTAGF